MPGRYLRSTFAVCLQPEHLWRTLAIAVIVGTWLTAFNQVDVLWYGEIDRWLAVKVFLNYLTPFVVANWGLISRQVRGG